MQHKPDYKEINRLEHELFPEWFKEEKPLPPASPAPPLTTKPGRKWKVSEPGDVRQVEAQSYGPFQLHGSAVPASAFGPSVSLAGLHPGTPLRPMRRQVVLPWDKPRS